MQHWGLAALLLSIPIARDHSFLMLSGLQRGLSGIQIFHHRLKRETLHFALQ